MKVIFHSLFISLSLVAPVMLMAQQRNSTDTIIPNQTIEIIQDYKPEVAPPSKQEWTPQFNIVDTSRPVFSYQVPQQSLAYTYHSIPIHPLALGKEVEKLPFQNYVKLGLGNLHSLLIDGGLAWEKSEAYEAQVHVYHLSQKSGKLDNQQSSNTSVDADGKYYLTNYVLNAGVHFFTNGYNYYGYNHDSYQYDKDDVHQSFLGLGVNVGLANTNENKWHLYYHPEASFSAFSDKHSASERSFLLNVPFRWQAGKSVSVLLGLKGDFTQFKNDEGSAGNNIFQINPAIRFNLEAVDLHIGVSPAFGKDKNYVLPDIYFKYHRSQSKFAILAGWKGDLVQNTYQQLTDKNPYLYNIYTTKQTKYQQVYAGFESAFGSHLSLNATLSWRQWYNLPLFVNDYQLHADGKYYTIVYDDKAQGLALNANAQYRIGDKINVGAEGAWTNFYKLSDNDKAWMEPMLRFTGTFGWQVFRPLHFNARADFWDGMYARLQNGASDKMPALFDLSAGAEYNILPRVSLFVQLNNILGKRYERWYQYPVYGFNIIGGLRIKF